MVLGFKKNGANFWEKTHFEEGVCHPEGHIGPLKNEVAGVGVQGALLVVPIVAEDGDVHSIQGKLNDVCGSHGKDGKQAGRRVEKREKRARKRYVSTRRRVSKFAWRVVL
jgi:hypothetical protein